MAITSIDAHNAASTDAGTSSPTSSRSRAHAGSTGRRIVSVVGHFATRWWAVVLVIVAWHLWVTLAGFNRIVMPTPLEVASDLVRNPGAYAGDTARTLSMGIFGLVVGMALGYAIAVGSWVSPLLSGITSPLVLLVRSIPIVAIIPVIARVVGYGNSVVPVVTVILAFFPAYVMTTSGLRAAPATSRDVFTALGADRWTTLRRLLVPASLPHLAVAFRLCASSTILAAMVAEFLVGTSGLGRLFSTARYRFETDRAFGAAVIATVASVLLFQLSLRVERYVRARYR